MKQIIGSVLTLSILLLLGILHLQRLETIIHTTNAYLEQALLAEGSSEAAASAGQAAQYWNGVQTFLGLTLRHDQLDQVSEELTLLKSYAQSKDVDDFRSRCLSLCKKLSHILQMERPVPENII